MLRILVLICFLFGQAFSQENSFKPTVILISFDGFRWDYPERTSTPNLHELIQTGVRAKGLIPSFPTKTFTNHYTIVTGLYAENHGIVSNSFYDKEFDETFSYKKPERVTESRWWGGEPIWVTAEKQGKIAATYFWPGSEATINGYAPTYAKAYDGRIPDSSRIDHILAWLDLPVEKRPQLITLYFSHSDEIGHKVNPDSAAILPAIAHLDSMTGRLITGLKQRNLFDKVHIIIVSDHGMAAVSRDRMVFLDDYLDMETVDVIYESPIFSARGKTIPDSVVYAKLLNAHPKMMIYTRATMPERFHYSKSMRIGPVFGVMAEGWSVTTRKKFKENSNWDFGGSHGYDNLLQSMQGIFIAHGPEIEKNKTIEPFANIHIYNLMAHLLGLTSAPNDGSIDVIRPILRR
ncbi:ectonucleotide pyrophosphatase/phosphodiesterase [bacterium]|nr:ectonucleotide pyrophosphatase/phosphodiesterase [bacterium]